MRTNIDIDDYLMNEAMQISGHKTKKETVEDALNLMIQIKRQEEIREFRGKLKWESELDDLRTN